MMNPDDGDSEELEAVPSDMFDSGPSPVSALGWATGAFKGVSSRVEGVSSRMSLRAKDMLSSVADDHDNNNGSSSPHSNGSAAGAARSNGSLGLFNNDNSSSASGILNGIADEVPTVPAVDEAEVSRLVASMDSTTQLAEKMVAMTKLSNVLGDGDGAGQASQSTLCSVAEALVALLRDAEYFDPFFANACIACAQQLLEAQGEAFAAEMVNAGAAQALLPLLDPKFELIRIEGLACLEALLVAERAKVCSQIVGVPTGMQALVDLLDDRWDEVRHQTVSLLAAFLTEQGGVPPPVDLQNFVAFQDGFDKLFKAADACEISGDVSLKALAAVSGALTDNPLSRKLFLAGGHLPRLPALLSVLRPGDVAEHPLVPPPQQQQQAATSSRRRWGWGRDKGQESAVARVEGNGSEGGNGKGPAAGGPPSSGGGRAAAAAPPPSSSSSQQQQQQQQQAGGDAEKGGWSGQVPVPRVRAALSLVSALVGCGREVGVTVSGEAPMAAAAGGYKHGLSAAVGATASTAAAAGDEVLSAVGREEGLLEAVCELALASPLAPAGGGPTWSEYGLPADCQRSAMEVLAVLVARHPANQSCLSRCQVRGAPMSVTLHGQKQLVSSESRNVVDALLELWLAASSAMEDGATAAAAAATAAAAAAAAETAADNEMNATAEVALLNRTLDAFLSGNTAWCKSVLAGVAAKHASAARLGDASRSVPPPASTGNPSSAPRGNDDVPVANGTSKERDVGGVAVMSTVAKIGLLCVRASSPAAPRSSKPGETEANGGGGEDDPLAAALRLRLLRRVLQAGGADARAIAASVGLPTGAAALRRGGERARESSAGESNGREEPSGVEGPIEEEQRGDGERGGGGGGGGSSDGSGEGGSGRRVRCGPPLTPALEVAMRLLADGYKCAVTRQTGVLEAEGEERLSPPSDLTHYLISLGELVLTWLSLSTAEGVGPALSRRLLASGSSWTLLRTFGRAFRPDLARRDIPPGNGGHIEEGRDAVASAAAATSADGRRLSDDPSLSYLHAVVAMVVGSFVSSGSNLASRALAAGIERYVGLFEFCRILDSASDWIAFAWPATAMHTPTHPGGSVAGEMRVPSFWVLAGDSTFSSRLVEIIQTAQMTMIDLIIKGGSESETTRRSTADQGAEEGAPPSSLRQEGGGGANTVDGGSREALEALLRRQQARIEELERRLLPPGANADHVDPAFVSEGCEQQHPTLTI